MNENGLTYRGYRLETVREEVAGWQVHAFRHEMLQRNLEQAANARYDSAEAALAAARARIDLLLSD